MSQVNLKGLVEHINQRTNVYSPIMEAVVNSIQSINKTNRKDGEVIIVLKRDLQSVLEFNKDARAEITSIEIHDNGIGFNEENTESFDMLYSQLKVNEGGKGYGRVMFLKYFEDISVSSIFRDGDTFSRRTFDCGKNNKMVDSPKLTKNVKESDTKTVIILNTLKASNLNKKNTTIAKKLLEKLLIYFINEKYQCPKIIIREKDEKDIVLNDLLTGDYAEIQKVGNKEYTLTNEGYNQIFQIKVFKIFFPDNQKSKISLTAHNREVTETPIHKYIPEFEDNFYQKFDNGIEKDYMIKTYVLGDYLDKHVILERIAFNFPKKGQDLLYSFSQEDIEREAARQTNELDIFKEEITTRKEKKYNKIVDYINNEAPWHKAYLEDLDLSEVPYNLNSEGIELEFQKAKFQQERSAREEVKNILDNPNNNIAEQVKEVVNKISKANMSEIAHYIALRKIILQLFKKSLEINPDGQYNSEGTVHNIIFPTRSNSNNTPYDNHNLWIIDEKLNFTEFISSDEPIEGGKSERTDLLIFNQKFAFRGDNEASNPITIFEFKKPQRDDFANPSSKEDPIQQLIRYVNDIKDGKYKTPKGIEILVGQNTPFYGFVVCSLTKKVTDWLLKEKDFQPMPDGKGWFKWYSNINLYVEVISWQKLLKDAEMKNKIFFRKLGI